MWFVIRRNERFSYFPQTHRSENRRESYGESVEFARAHKNIRGVYIGEKHAVEIKTRAISHFKVKMLAAASSRVRSFFFPVSFVIFSRHVLTSYPRSRFNWEIPHLRLWTHVRVSHLRGVSVQFWIPRWTRSYICLSRLNSNCWITQMSHTYHDSIEKLGDSGLHKKWE